jgi:hypothetical protein
VSCGIGYGEVRQCPTISSPFKARMRMPTGLLKAISSSVIQCSCITRKERRTSFLAAIHSRRLAEKMNASAKNKLLFELIAEAAKLRFLKRA